MDDPLFAVPGTRRSAADVTAIRRHLDQLANRDETDAMVQGALDAARWTLREVTAAPLSADRTADVLGVEAEWELAQGVALGLRPGDRTRAVGVQAWLEWWRCASAAPSWMAPTRLPRR